MDWGAYPGEMLELAMAVLVAQEHPDTVRRVPASGDGGIDLMVPDGGGVEVQQVKRFTGRLGGSERRQIRESWLTFRKDPRLSAPVTAYRLVMPLDPTPDEQAWFDELVADAPWPVTWRGATYWHTLASRHPHVIDYLFAGGRDRVAQRSMALQAALVDPTRPLDAVDVAASLNTMSVALNRDDPHYRYDLATSRTEPADDPDASLQRTTSLADGGFLTITVTPKHRYSYRDAPIQGTITLEIPAGELAERFTAAFDAFDQFGRTLDVPEGFVSMSLDAPGGLGGTFEGGTLSVAPASVETFLPAMRLAAVSPSGDDLGSIEIEVEQSTAGRAGGFEIHFTDLNRLIEGVLQLTPPDDDATSTGSFQFGFRDIVGRPVTEVLETIDVVEQSAPPNRLEFRHRHAKGTIFRSAEGVGRPVLSGDARRHLDDLATVQDCAERPILVPPETDAEFANELHRYARMLRGETITGTWDELTSRLNIGRSTLMATLEDGETALALDMSVQRPVADQVVDLGHFVTHFHSARLAASQPEDEREIRLIAGNDPTFTQRAGSIGAESPEARGVTP